MPTSLAPNKYFKKALKLGRIPTPAARRCRTVPLGPYLRRMGTTPPPDTVDWYSKATKSLATMLGNDTVGDCTVAAVLHEVGVASANLGGGKELVATTQEATTQYTAICGPGDQGCVVTDVLDYWRDKGLTAAGVVTRADGYASVDHTDQLAAKIATYLFGGLHLGINLPRDWYDSAAPGAVWDLTDSDIVGGHSVVVVGYDAVGLDISTWGIRVRMTWRAFLDARYVDEAYAVLPDAWYDANGLAGNGLDVAGLRAALQVVQSGGVPPIPDPGPTPTPTPTPPPTPPAGEGTYTGYMTALGQQFPITLVGPTAPASGARRSVEWMSLVVHVAQLATAIEAADWVSAAAAAEAILTDLGITPGSDAARAMQSAMTARAETAMIAPTVLRK